MAFLVAILALATLAVVLAVCCEADAFVATGLSQISLTSRLVFLVVGPTVDIKLIALQAGVFGRRFALAFCAVDARCHPSWSPSAWPNSSGS